ncbi:hypothetical protein NXT08_14940 [Rhodococcus pyridinivorans]|nr:hypothetical protein [Rhodococcus pyridinivorans]UVT23616.1 hypothetical protein NXT08_14940 [Rhodococcus pyridinivorans]
MNVEIAEHCLQFVYDQPGRDIAARIASPSVPVFNPAKATISGKR